MRAVLWAGGQLAVWYSVFTLTQSVAVGFIGWQFWASLAVLGVAVLNLVWRKS